MPEAARSAAFFDLDKTIIATSSSAAFSRPLLNEGMLTRSSALRTAYAQFLFQIGGADERQTNRLRDALSELIRGWDQARLREVVEETVHEHIDPVVYDEALELIRLHHENGRDVIIVSASAYEVVKPIADILGADGVIATRMEVEDGLFTGEISFYAYGENKASAVREMAEERGYDLARSFAYSDSLTDTPLLNAVGHGYAINPDRALRRAAADNGWGQLRFTKPVALRSGTSPVRLAVAVVLVVGVAATVWLVARSVRTRTIA